MTPAQHAALTFIVDYIGEHDYPPTQREIAAHLHTSGATVWKHLQALESYGCIRRRKHGTRAIVVLRLTPAAHKPRRKSSQYRGVAKHSIGPGWFVQVKRGGKHVFVGYRHSELEAARLYDRYVREHRLNRPLNFPDAA